ncbi:hypothetical protein BaRGS_00037863, partial [Batillaria attramentaria]
LERQSVHPKSPASAANALKGRLDLTSCATFVSAVTFFCSLPAMTRKHGGQSTRHLLDVSHALVMKSNSVGCALYRHEDFVFVLTRTGGILD